MRRSWWIPTLLCLAQCTGGLGSEALDGESPRVAADAAPRLARDGGARDDGGDAATAIELDGASPSGDAAPLRRDARPIRRDSGPLGDTPLALLAASMAPGTWARLEGTTLRDAGLANAPPPGEGLSILGWTDDAHWDSRTHQVFYMGLRKARRFVAYDEVANAWYDIPFDGEENAPHFTNKWGHIYGNNAFDIARSRFYHLAHGGPAVDGYFPETNTASISYYDVLEARWVRIPMVDPYRSTGAIEYFGARDELVYHTGAAYSEAIGEWRDGERPPIHGHHSVARHNPVREEVIFMGGNETPRVIAVLDREGHVERWPDAPFDVSVRGTKVTHDPVSGHYLILDDQMLWELDGDTRTFYLVEDFSVTPWPFPPYAYIAMTAVPEYGVVFWFSERSMVLYKHDR
jgi:hypothetical protein